MNKLNHLAGLEAKFASSTDNIDNETEFFLDFYEGMDLDDDKEFRGQPDLEGDDSSQQTAGNDNPSDTPSYDSKESPKNPDLSSDEENPSSDDSIGDFPFSDENENGDSEEELSFEEADFDNTGNRGDANDDNEMASQFPESSISEGHAFDGIRGFSRQEIDGRIEITREFDSWYDFVTCVSNDRLREWKKYRCSHGSNSAGGVANFRGTDSFEQAEEMALRTGWPEGRKMLHDFMLQIQPKPTIRPASEFDVAGMFPCVPIYCAGDPASMFSDAETNMRISKPVIKIDFSQIVSYTVTINDIMLRGAAVLSLVNTLESSGYNIELRLVGANITDKFRFFNYITYKPANQPLDLDRAAFAIAHSSTLRRLLFALWEQHSEIEDSFGYGYGRPSQTPPPLSRNQNTIFIPNSLGHETPETARAAVKAAAERILKDKIS